MATPPALLPQPLFLVGAAFLANGSMPSAFAIPLGCGWRRILRPPETLRQGLGSVAGRGAMRRFCVVLEAMAEDLPARARRYEGAVTEWTRRPRRSISH